jgi:hypothetical protein
MKRQIPDPIVMPNLEKQDGLQQRQPSASNSQMSTNIAHEEHPKA